MFGIESFISTSCHINGVTSNSNVQKISRSDSIHHIPNHVFESFAQSYFGSCEIDSVELCSMEPTNGYYNVIATIPFITQSVITLSNEKGPNNAE